LGSVALVVFLQMGQRSLMVDLRGIFDCRS
jgi:hypothetical protein